MRPHLLLALVAMCALAACQQSNSPQTTKAKVVPDSADQVLFGVKFFLADGGIRRAELVADTAYMYEDNTRTDLRVVNTTFFKSGGEKDAVLTSLTGTYNVRLGNMEARGNVVVVSTDGRRLTTPHLRYDPARNEISSDSSFTLIDNGGRTNEGIGFLADPDLNNVRVLKRSKSSGNQLTIPKS